MVPVNTGRGWWWQARHLFLACAFPPVLAVQAHLACCALGIPASNPPTIPPSTQVENCETCASPTATECQQCVGGYGLVNGQCKECTATNCDQVSGRRT